MVDLKNASSVDGNVGIAFAGADGYRLLSLNTANLDWITLNITTYVAGAVTAEVLLSTNI